MVRIHDGVSTGAQNPGAGEPAHAHNGARRATLARLAGLCGLALSGEALAALAAPQTKDKAKGPKVLTRDELALTGVLAELVIPQTDTPGALAAGAHHTIDHLLAVAAGKAAQQTFKAGLARLDAVAVKQEGKRFAQLPAVRQTALLRALDEAGAPFNRDDQRFFRTFKQHTLFAYYTSEAGATQELAYLPVPGGYKGDVKVSSETRTWAL